MTQLERKLEAFLLVGLIQEKMLMAVVTVNHQGVQILASAQLLHFPSIPISRIEGRSHPSRDRPEK